MRLTVRHFGLAAAALLLSASPALAGKVKIKNCLKERIFVCSYNGYDKVKGLPADTAGIKPGKSKALKCTTKRCKVFAAASEMKPARYVDKVAYGLLAGGGGAAIVGGAAGGAAFAGSGVVAVGVIGGATAGFAGGALAGMAIAKGVEAGDTGQRCKKIIKAVKKGGGGRVKAKGKFTIKAMSDGEQVLIYTEDGHTDCGASPQIDVDKVKKGKKGKKGKNKRKKRRRKK